MHGLSSLWARLRDRFDLGLTPLQRTIRRAHRALEHMTTSGIAVPDDVVRAVMGAAAAERAGTITPEVEGSFYAANARLIRLRRGLDHDEHGEFERPFDAALLDADLMLKYAAERGLEVTADTVRPLLRAQALATAGTMTEDAQAEFYAAYGRLCRQFGDVTADTIRACKSEHTARILHRNQRFAVILTVLIATCSVMVFVADRLSEGIHANIESANEAAARLRTTVNQADIAAAIPADKRDQDPCDLLTTEPSGGSRDIKTPAEIEPLQHFAALVRAIHSQAIKLNWAVGAVGLREVDPFRNCDTFRPPETGEACRHRMVMRFELEPSVRNHAAEVLCKIRTFQSVRSFASNVQADYKAAIGGLASYAFPILYAWLGAYAFRLRLFVDTIRNRTYHPSFADSARMITAVIAGAIAGLFNPATGSALSPLATAFLVGYGVELFFRFLDTLLAAFGSSSRAQKPS